MLPLVASVLALAAPAPATALVQIDRAQTGPAAPLLHAVGAVEVGPELRVWRVPSAAVAALRRHGVVAFSEPERLYVAAAVPSDPLVGDQWWRASVGADRATPPGPGKPVTIVDSGLDMSHPEFANRPNTTVLNPQTVRTDEDDHGTEVGSVIGAPENGIGLVGVYPLADLRSWDASPRGFFSDGAAIEGVLAAARGGPGLINLSFGGPVPDPLLEEAILTAVKEGSLVVAAAGNDGFRGSPASFPAQYPHVLTVGATDSTDAVARFSTASPYVDLAAPGVSIPVAEPTFDEPSGFTRASGTSFSSPMVAGAAAWVWTVRPELDNSQLFELMRRSARDIDSPGVDVRSGYGILDIPAALAYPTPAADPLEPNDDADQIEPGRLFAGGEQPLTTAGHGAASISANVDQHEDPRDFYRVLVPAHRRATATTHGAVDLRIYRRTSRPLRAKPVAISAHRGAPDRVTFANRTAHAVFAYVEVTPEGAVRDARYTLTVATSARP